MDPIAELDATLDAPDSLHSILQHVEAIQAAGRWTEALDARVRDRVFSLREAQDFRVERASHWTFANYTKLIDPFSVTFGGTRHADVFDQTRFGLGLARTLRLVSNSRWDRKLDARDAAAIAENPALAQLQGIEVEEQALGGAGVAALASSPHLTSLRALSITGSKTGPEGAWAIANNPALANLEILILSQGRLGNGGVEVLARSPHLRRLRVLVLDENQLAATAFRSIAQSETLAGLTWLSLCSNKEAGAAAVTALAASPHLRAIETLHLARVNMRTTGAKALAKSPILDSVRVLNVLGNDLTPTGQAALTARMEAIRSAR